MEPNKKPTLIFKEINETSKILSCICEEIFPIAPSPASLQGESMFQALTF